MKYKSRIGICVFTLGVLMLLLRPYLTYSITRAANKTNPAQNLLQRSVKKKDDCHEQQAELRASRVLQQKTTIYAVPELLCTASGRIPVMYLFSWQGRESDHCFQPGAP